MSRYRRDEQNSRTQKRKFVQGQRVILVCKKMCDFSKLSLAYRTIAELENYVTNSDGLCLVGIVGILVYKANPRYEKKQFFLPGEKFSRSMKIVSFYFSIDFLNPKLIPFEICHLIPYIDLKTKLAFFLPRCKNNNCLNGVLAFFLCLYKKEIKEKKYT